MKVTTEDFEAAKKAVKAAGAVDSSAKHRIAIEVLRSRCPKAGVELVADMAWEVVLAAL